MTQRQIQILLAGILTTFSTIGQEAQTAEQCLAKAIYYEARGESAKGKLAVAQVVLNRAASKQYPGSVCGVVYQPKQFSWTSMGYKISNNATWHEAQVLANKVLSRGYALANFPATHFHNTSVNPRWKLRHVATIGNHIFYS